LVVFPIWVILLGLVAWAVCRQVRAHLELRRAFADFAARQQVLVHRLTQTIDLMEKTELRGSQLQTFDVLDELDCLAAYREVVRKVWLEAYTAGIDWCHMPTRYVRAMPRTRDPHEPARAWEDKEDHEDAEWYASAAAC
jgi:hypothetical protein